MKKEHLVVVFAVIAAVFAGLYLKERRNTPQAIAPAVQASAVEEDVEALTDRLAKLERQLENKNLEIRNLSAQLEREVATGEVVEVNDDWVDPDIFSEGETEKTGKVNLALPKISFTGPDGEENELDLQEMIPKAVQQQRNVQNAMRVDRVYADLFDQLGLGEEQSDRLKQLLVERQDSGFSFISLFGGEETESEARSQRDIDGDIKSLLGDETYADFESYEETKTSRVAANKLQGVLASRDLAMNADQRQKMVDLYHDVRGSNQPVDTDIEMLSGLGGGDPFAGDSNFMVFDATGKDEETRNAALEKRAEEYDQILTGAQNFLDAPQVDELNKHFDRQMQKKEVNSSMMQSFSFGENGNGAIQGGAISIAVGGVDVTEAE